MPARSLRRPLGITAVFASLLALTASSLPAQATSSLAVKSARIEMGKLKVWGIAPTGSVVRLDGLFTARRYENYFFFDIVYLPSDCIVDLALVGATGTARAVVAYCGPRGVNPQGGWSMSRTYVENDLVTDGGSSWRAKHVADLNLNKPPASNPLFWEKFAAKGEDGLDGQDGADGAMGPQGPAGDTGPQGAPGAQGAAGARGPAGATGPQGAAGSTGPQGADGPQGATGAMGARGPAGVAGPQGADGATGAQGDTGATGPAGVAGPQGATGPVGARGPAGVAGPQGADGATGPQGADGAAGATGAQGPAGDPGPQGVAGNPGAQGATGPQGPTGILSMHPFAGDIGAGPLNNHANFVFVGPTVNVMLAAGLKITGSAGVPLAVGAGSPSITVDIGLCYRATLAATPTSFLGVSTLSATVDTSATSQAASGSVSGLVAGAYRVGACIRNSGPVAITGSRFVNGWVMVHN